MSDEKKEEVLLETKLENPSKPQIKLNEDHATIEIAKSLIQDFTFIVTMTCVKAVFANLGDREQILDKLQTVWKKRASAQLSRETKEYQDAIFKAFENQKEISEKTTEEMNKYLKSYCDVRDKAMKIAENSIQDIVKMILSTKSTDEVEEEQKQENEEKKDESNG